MFNYIARILGSKSCKTDLSLSDSSAESLWNITSFPVSPGREPEEEIARYYFMEGMPVYSKSCAKSQHKRDKQFHI